MSLASEGSHPDTETQRARAKVLHEFLDFIEVELPYSHEVLHWIFDQYLNGTVPYSFDNLLVYSAFPLVARADLYQKLCHALGQEAREQPTRSDWLYYLCDYAKDNYGEKLKHLVRGMCIVSYEFNLLPSHRKKHWPYLLTLTKDDPRILEEVEAALTYYQSAQPFKWTPIPTGYDRRNNRILSSPCVRTASLLPSRSSPCFIPVERKKTRRVVHDDSDPYARIYDLTGIRRYSNLFGLFGTTLAREGKPVWRRR